MTDASKPSGFFGSEAAKFLQLINLRVPFRASFSAHASLANEGFQIFARDKMRGHISILKQSTPLVKKKEWLTQNKFA